MLFPLWESAYLPGIPIQEVKLGLNQRSEGLQTPKNTDFLPAFTKVFYWKWGRLSRFLYLPAIYFFFMPLYRKEVLQLQTGKTEG